MAKTFIQLRGLERDTPPVLPDVDHLSLYPKSDNSWYSLDSDGNEVRLSNAVPGEDAALTYRAKLLGANGSLTSALVSHSDFSDEIVWAYTSEGVYTGTLSGVFVADQTNLQATLGTGAGGVIVKLEHTSANAVTLRGFSIADGTTAADIIGNVFVSITVDPIIIS